MSMKWIAAALVGAFMVPASASGFFDTGNNLLEKWDGTPVARSYALGFIVGTYDSMSAEQACLPELATKGQISEVVIKFIRDDPSVRHLQASTLVKVSLATTFPCAAKRPGNNGNRL